MDQDAPIDQPGEWEPRQRVGPYTLITKLAIGGMAEIWLARQSGVKGFEKLVVVKKMATNLSSDPDFVEMFLDEARIAAQLNHPNIVQILDLGEQSGAYYIAMEYLNGENLSNIARTGKKLGKPLPIPHAVRIIASAAEGLGHAHTKRGNDGKPLNIVHRDVSPQNLLVTYDGVVKVLDFGIAKAANRATHTVGAQLKGKMSYMAPEQARGQPLDARADVFALGIVLYESITGTRLFHFDDGFQALAAITSTDPIPPASRHNPAVPKELDAVINKSLARAKEQRYQTAREMQFALERWLHTQPSVPGTDAIADYMVEVFRDRIDKRAKLIETARLGELTPSSFSPGLMAGTPRSMPGATDPRLDRTTIERGKAESAPRATPRRWIPFAAVGGAALMLVGLYVAIRSRPTEPAALRLPDPAVLLIETDPPGAVISVDGQPKGNSPLTLSGLAFGDHAVVATAEGRPPATRRIRLEQPGEHLQVFLALQVPTPPPPTPVAPPPEQATAPQTVKAHEVRRGKLTLVTTPWTRVYLGSRVLGDTPLVEVSLPAGRQTLKMVNDDQGIKKSIEVEIEPGKLTVKRLSL